MKHDSGGVWSHGAYAADELNQGRMAYYLPLTIPLMKYKIVCFCPWWKSSHGGHRGQTPKLVSFIIRYSDLLPLLCVIPPEQNFFRGGRKCPWWIFFKPFPKRGICPLWKILGTPLHYRKGIFINSNGYK